MIFITLHKVVFDSYGHSPPKLWQRVFPGTWGISQEHEGFMCHIVVNWTGNLLFTIFHAWKKKPKTLKKITILCELVLSLTFHRGLNAGKLDTICMNMILLSQQFFHLDFAIMLQLNMLQHKVEHFPKLHLFLLYGGHKQCFFNILKVHFSNTVRLISHMREDDKCISLSRLATLHLICLSFPCMEVAVFWKLYF